jgi:hypothetical protein
MAATISIGGVDVTGVAISGHSTRRLNRPSQAQVRIPSQNAIGDVGDALKISFNGTLHHHGRILLIETEMGEDTGYTTYNSTDPMEMWAFRPARDGPLSSDPGDMSNPLMFSGDDFPATGPEIFEQMFLQSEDDSDPALGEGPLFLDLGTIETDGCDLGGAPTDWPMTMAEVTSLMVSTGCLDVVIAPTDPGGGIMGTVSAYNGDYGTDLSGSVSFDYGQGNFNVRALRWNQDMSNMCNKLWYFMGPRIQTAADPQGNQHWCYNVQGDDPALQSGEAYDPLPNGVSAATFFSDRSSSRSSYGVRMEVQIFDAGECTPNDPDSCCDPLNDPLTVIYRSLYRRRWQTESWIRQQPRNLIHITPTRESGIMGFDIGDLVGVTASSAVRGGFSGAQRVYEYTISWDENGVLALSELQTSDTADA